MSTTVSRASGYSGSYTYRRQTGTTIEPLQVTVHGVKANDTRTGDIVPNYKALISNHISATSTLSGTKYRYTHTPGEAEIYYYHGSLKKFVSDYCHGALIYPDTAPNVSSISLTKANNVALMRLIRKARKIQTTFQGSVAIGELRESLRMIRRPLGGLHERFLDYFTQVKKLGRSKKFARLPNEESRIRDFTRTLSGLYLEHQFGWKPLLNDVHSATEALAKRVIESRIETQAFKVSGTESTKASYEPSFQRAHSILVWDWSQREEYLAQVIYRGAVKREVTSDLKWDLKHFGFYWPEDFLPTVWELVPYSFVIDYFTNVGEIVSAASFHRSSFAWLNKTTRKVATKIGQPTGVRVEYARQQVQNTGGRLIDVVDRRPSYRFERVEILRSPYGGSIVPTFEFSLPENKGVYANLAALTLAHLTAVRHLGRSIEKWSLGTKVPV